MKRTFAAVDERIAAFVKDATWMSWVFAAGVVVVVLNVLSWAFR